MALITYGYVVTSLLRLKRANVRPPGDCAGLQINDETTARCRSFALMTELKARGPLRYRNCFSPLVSWCIGTIVVDVKRRDDVAIRPRCTAHSPLTMRCSLSERLP